MIRLHNAVPVMPHEIADEIEMYARENGRHSRNRFDRDLGCFITSLTLKADDKRLLAWKEGRLTEEPTEGVCWHQWNAEKNRYVPMNLEEYGPSGVRNMLEKANTFSGRGEFSSLQAAIEFVQEQSKREMEKLRETAKQSAVERAVDMRRQIGQIPYLTVKADLKPNNEAV